MNASDSHPLPQPARLLIAFLLLAFVPATVFDLLERSGLEGSPGLLFGCHLVGVVALLVFAWKLPSVMAFRPAQVMQAAKAYFAFALLWWPLVVGYLLLMHAVGLTVEPQPILVEAAEGGWQSAGNWWNLGNAAILAPVGEEIVFRGYLLGALLQVVPSKVAQLIAATAFGLIHGWSYALPTGLLGLLFGWLCVQQRSMLPAMIAHSIHNALTFCVVLSWPGLLQLQYPS
ncbi:MAG: CPBP family intramembrane glutamic endopeptidase [Planctomycetota bacterium]|nr:CPBP family intramembrane glutamic endopeptidase [Planctomycetota bacterium]